MGTFANKGETITVFSGVVITNASPVTWTGKLSQSSGAMGGYLVSDGQVTIMVKVRNGTLPFIVPLNSSGVSMASLLALVRAGSIAQGISLGAFEEYQFTAETLSGSNVTVTFLLYIDNKE
jgi:hypothetical protein